VPGLGGDQTTAGLGGNGGGHAETSVDVAIGVVVWCNVEVASRSAVVLLGLGEESVGCAVVAASVATSAAVASNVVVDGFVVVTLVVVGTSVVVNVVVGGWVPTVVVGGCVVTVVVC